jgi:hypothetical protein
MVINGKILASITGTDFCKSPLKTAKALKGLT